jgi:hypothetical protein
MVSASSHLQPPIPPQPSQLWATLTKHRQEECVVEVTQEDDDDEIDELVGDEGKPWHPSASTYTHARHTPHHLRTLEGMVMGPLPKMLFGFEIGNTHAWSQVSLAGPRTCSTAVTILDVVWFLR